MKSEGELKKLQDLNDELQSQISVLQASLSAAEKAAQEAASKERPPQPNH
jgi:predicted  nucleic acid-binding Zn-ribbon protein